jgi:hypothetical protein
MRVEISVLCFASSWLKNTRGESCISQQVGQFDHRHKLLPIGDCVKQQYVRIPNEIGNRQYHNGRRQATCATLKLQSRQTNIQEDSYGRQ